MKVRYLSVAVDEFEEAVNFYNKQRSGLGFEFAAEVKNALGLISQNPEAWSPFSERSRKCLTNRFPYNIIYQEREDHILIVGMMHQKRDPVHWKQRIEGE